MQGGAEIGTRTSTPGEANFRSPAFFNIRQSCKRLKLYYGHVLQFKHEDMQEMAWLELLHIYK